MNETIAEKAKQYSMRNFDGFFTGFESLEEKAYIKGATEQRKADIEKACEWLKENVEKYLYNRGGFEEYIPTCGGKLFTDFKKAMEE